MHGHNRYKWHHILSCNVLYFRKAPYFRGTYRFICRPFLDYPRLHTTQKTNQSTLWEPQIQQPYKYGAYTNLWFKQVLINRVSEFVRRCVPYGSTSGSWLWTQGSGNSKGAAPRFVDQDNRNTWKWTVPYNPQINTVTDDRMTQDRGVAFTA